MAKITINFPLTVEAELVKGQVKILAVELPNLDAIEQQFFDLPLEKQVFIRAKLRREKA